MRKLIRKPKVLEELVKEPVKKRIRVIYRKKRCDFTFEHGVPCSNYAVGSGNVCKTHGGNPIAPESLTKLDTYNLPDSSGCYQKYDPVVHPKLYIEYSRIGMSLVEIAAEFKVKVQTIKDWAEKFESFAEVFEIGEALHESWWIRQGKNNLNSRFFQTGLYKFLTGNKIGWADKIETRNINQNSFGVLVVPGKVSVDDWEQKNIDDKQKLIELKNNLSNVIDDVIEVEDENV
jgi:hypothetical protein